MEAYGVYYQAFPLQIQEIYVEAFHAIGYLIGEVGGKIFTLSGLYSTIKLYIIPVVIFTFFYYKYHKKRNSQPPKTDQHFWEYSFPKALVEFLFYLTVLITGVLYAFLLLAIIFFILAINPHKAGIETQQDRISSFMKNGCHVEEESIKNNCVSISDEQNHLLHEGLLITMNNQSIAIFKKDGSYIFNRKENMVIKRKFFKLKK
jgi:preprotein translocase subunit YajC